MLTKKSIDDSEMLNPKKSISQNLLLCKINITFAENRTNILNNI